MVRAQKPAKQETESAFNLKCLRASCTCLRASWVRFWGPQKRRGGTLGVSWGRPGRLVGASGAAFRATDASKTKVSQTGADTFDFWSVQHRKPLLNLIVTINKICFECPFGPRAPRCLFEARPWRNCLGRSTDFTHNCQQTMSSRRPSGSRSPRLPCSRPDSGKVARGAPPIATTSRESVLSRPVWVTFARLPFRGELWRHRPERPAVTIITQKFRPAALPFSN